MKDKYLEQEVEHIHKGLGDREVSMTEATALLWGTSGGGSPVAVKRIEHFARLGYLEIRKAGRARYVRAAAPK